tara:strand:- start:1585 stop:1782 length:198 start_codon:yes stop_codon:yes gene_type:complete
MSGGFREGEYDVKIEGMAPDQIDALLKKYKKLNKYRRSSIFAIKTLDGTENVVAPMVKEAEDLEL